MFGWKKSSFNIIEIESWRKRNSIRSNEMMKKEKRRKERLDRFFFSVLFLCWTSTRIHWRDFSVLFLRLMRHSHSQLLILPSNSSRRRRRRISMFCRSIVVGSPRWISLNRSFVFLVNDDDEKVNVGHFFFFSFSFVHRSNFIYLQTIFLKRIRQISSMKIILLLTNTKMNPIESMFRRLLTKPIENIFFHRQNRIDI